MFSSAWNGNHGAPPPILVLGRADGTGKLQILRTQVRDGTSADIAVTTACFQDIAGAGDGLEVRFRAAGFWTRVIYRPGAPLDLIVAVLGLLGIITAAVVGFVGGIVKPGIPFWLLLVAFGVAMVVGVARFVQDMRKPSIN